MIYCTLKVSLLLLLLHQKVTNVLAINFQTTLTRMNASILTGGVPCACNSRLFYFESIIKKYPYWKYSALINEDACISLSVVWWYDERTVSSAWHMIGKVVQIVKSVFTSCLPCKFKRRKIVVNLQIIVLLITDFLVLLLLW